MCPNQEQNAQLFSNGMTLQPLRHTCQGPSLSLKLTSSRSLPLKHFTNPSLVYIRSPLLHTHIITHTSSAALIQFSIISIAAVICIAH